MSKSSSVITKDVLLTYGKLKLESKEQTIKVLLRFPGHKSPWEASSFQRRLLVRTIGEALWLMTDDEVLEKRIQIWLMLER